MRPEAPVLPVLRPDIEFHRGPDEADGSPSYVIHDPLQGSFDKATWVQARILRLLRVPRTVDRVLADLRRRTTIRVTEEEVRSLCADASNRGLTRDACVTDTSADHQQSCAFPSRARKEAVASHARKPLPHGRGSDGGSASQTPSKTGRWDRMLWRLLYLRIPLVSPDAFLARTLRFVRPLGHPVALTLYVFTAALGLMFLVQRFDAYVSTFPYFFNPRGAAAFTLTIIGLKVVHEFSHAYVAKAMGNRVATMGVTLILLFPVAYADVTDSWRMRSRRKRLLIGLAGVTAELAIAGIALLTWAVSAPGLLKSLCFLLSSTTLLATLLVNLNPLMRFDGYYLLCDLVGIDNLQSRSYALARWALRRYVLGLQISPPEPVPTPRRLAFMTTYAMLSWLYRLFLYSGIALAIYHRLAKAVGGVLFGFALYTLIARPVASELAAVIAVRRRLGWNPRLALAAAGLALVFSWAALPLTRWTTAPATTVARESQVIYVPRAGVIRDLRAGPGHSVRRGDLLLTVAPEELEARRELARLEVQRVGIELAVVRTDPARRALLRQKTEELARAQAALETTRAAIEASRIIAEVEGVIAEWDESVREGMPVAADHVIGKIINDAAPYVVCYVSGDLVSDIQVDEQVWFSSRDRACRIAGAVKNIDPLRATVLEHRNLASIAGGDIAVAPDLRGRLNVNDSLYAVEVELDPADRPLRAGQTGDVWLRARPRSHLADLASYLHRVLIRESGF